MDDLNSFFAKKAAKKKKNVQDTVSLAKRLEKAVKQQMQIDINQEEERISAEKVQAVEAHRPETEDSEWIDVQEELDMDLTGKGLKELDIEEIHEVDKIVSNERVEKPKTWSLANSATEIAKMEDDAFLPTEDKPPIVVEQKKPAAYVPPMLKQKLGAANKEGQKPNLQDAEEFPSLMAADDFSKKEHEKKKLKAQQTKEFEEREKELLGRREKDGVPVAAGADRPIGSPTPAPDPAKPAAYVAPHRRKQ